MRSVQKVLFSCSAQRSIEAAGRALKEKGCGAGRMSLDREAASWSQWKHTGPAMRRVASERDFSSSTKNGDDFNELLSQLLTPSSSSKRNVCRREALISEDEDGQWFWEHIASKAEAEEKLIKLDEACFSLQLGALSAKEILWCTKGHVGG